MKGCGSSARSLAANGLGIYAVLPKAQLSAVAKARKGNIDIYGVLATVFLTFKTKTLWE